MPSSLPTQQSSRFQGTIPPIVTPLADDDRLDDAGCERLLEHLIEGGVDGIFLLGSSGEIVSLSQQLRADFVRKACRIINQRVPVFVGITDNSVVETKRFAQVASDAGADAVVLTTPFYYPIDQSELKTFVQSVLQGTDLPLLLYNMPAMTKLWFEAETVAELAQMDQIVGIKDSSQDLDYFRQLTSLKSVRPDWTFLIGHETLLAESLRVGGTGGVNLGTNLFPSLFSSLMQAHRANDDAAVQGLQTKIDSLAPIYKIANSSSPLLPLIGITKTALSIMGICNDRLAPPHHPCTPEQRQQLTAVIERLKTTLGA
ncbi:putative 2-keto-3-deoxy-galactonate aldolase YagE [Rosistilla ulvae]|uniref:Putative 2-keto-3-deoxy-galactonate aldolase YagE n=1 Tax=Rosistilla ulvae TaxID=1930277 RepID=A0A517M4Y1_9BACT|nr:dihydrodipicolinate synthase family protein [Rosistilla ulvae]QDS89924.1 putative 2-keto-3-deoxy-galactonate aldolase YagE [Rosistilla ulvae]